MHQSMKNLYRTDNLIVSDNCSKETDNLDYCIFPDIRPYIQWLLNSRPKTLDARRTTLMVNFNYQSISIIRLSVKQVTQDQFLNQKGTDYIESDAFNY